MAVADELIARLKSVPGVAAVFDTETPDSYTLGSAPTLVLQHVSGVGQKTIVGGIYASEERWQVSVLGAHVGKVREVAQAVIDALHGYSSDAIRRVDYESWPGTIAEGKGSTREYHAPVDFMVFV